MTPQEQEAIARMRDRWFAGGSAFDIAPATWRDLLPAQDGLLSETTLLALAGQAFQVACSPAAPAAFRSVVQLPELALPTLPAQARVYFRIALKECATNLQVGTLLDFLAGRGYAVHPLDWMPSSGDMDVPAAYAPWADWVASRDAGGPASADELTEDNWDDHYPASRRAALSRLRRRDADAARALLEKKVAAETAEKRLRLVQVLEIGLGEGDVPFLQALSSDRSGKIKTFAASMLARLSVGAGDEERQKEDAAELADFFETRTGLLRRRRSILPKKLKTGAQERRRQGLFDACSLSALAVQLGLSEAELVEQWSFNSVTSVDTMFVALAVRTASDATVIRLADAVSAAGGEALTLSGEIVPRLPRQIASDLLLQAFRSLAVGSLVELEESIPVFSFMDDATALALPLTRTIIETSVGQEDLKGKRERARGLRLLAYATTQSAARALLDRLVTAGVSPADAALSFLQLGSMLSPNEHATPE